MTERVRRRRRRSLPPAPRRPALIAAIAGSGLILAALSVYQGVAQMGVIGDSPSVLSAEAWALLEKGDSVETRRSAQAMAQQALRRDPLQAGALALIAALREDKGDAAGASHLMNTAAALDHRNNVVDYWLLNKGLQSREWEQAALHADALLRRELAPLSGQLFPIMLSAMNEPAMVDAVAKRMAMRPQWRTPFLLFASSRAKDPRPLLAVYSAMKTAGAAPTSLELDNYFRRLIADKRYDEAYLSWVLFLPENVVSKLDNIYDGEFEGWPETPPFGWTLGGMRASVESSEQYGRDGSALRVDYDGMGLPKLPSQLLILTPGDYQFSGLALTANEESAGRMQWSLSCDGAGSLLPDHPTPNTKGKWMSFSLAFTVPEGCKGQVLELKPIPGGQRQTIEVWYDRLAISRGSATAATEAVG